MVLRTVLIEGSKITNLGFFQQLSIVCMQPLLSQQLLPITKVTIKGRFQRSIAVSSREVTA